MNLRELVGKKVVRTKPVLLNSVGFGMFGVGASSPSYDYSFCDLKDCVTVVNVVNDVPMIEKDNIIDDGKTITGIPLKYDDDNWKDVTEAYEYMQNANKIKNE